MQNFSDQAHRQGQRISFVPTMGYFHEGHLSLMEKGKSLCDVLVVSIFVNPTQFGENEDLDSYPSDIERDLELARKTGASAVFLPPKEEMYPDKYQTFVQLSNLPHHLCGISRPVHFRGVATVVTKLFNCVRPDVAIFGSKDFQQLQVIRQMALDLNYATQIVGCPIVREKDGLAMSSRNTYLTPEQRQSALSLSKALKKAEVMILQGEKNSKTLIKEIKAFILSFPGTEIDYAAVCDPQTLDDVQVIGSSVLIALAVKVGKTRLIDNCLIEEIAP